jgi:pimeloyl-ACP methyl ester carboxylesterase
MQDCAAGMADVRMHVRYVDAGSLRVLVREWGDEFGRTVLGWHGLGGDAAQLDGLARALVTRLGGRFVAPDAPGFGGSPAIPAEHYALADLADACVALLDRLGVASAAFVGQSWGAEVGCWLAARHPSRIDALALLDWGYVDDDDFEALGLPGLAERLAGIAASSAVAQQKVVAEAIERAGAAFPRTRTYPALARSGVPVLLLHATVPAAVTPARSRLLARFADAVPHARVVPIHGAGHNLLADAEADVSTHLATFLRAAMPR